MTAFSAADAAPVLPLPPAPRPAPPAPATIVPGTRRRIAFANAVLARAWAKGWANTPSLDPAALVAKAADRAGAPAGDDAIGWRDRLELLCTDLERTARLTPLGRTLAHGALVAALTARFRAHALWRRHPTIAERPLPRPIVIVGQMRSGSTRMQRLLACDPRLAFTRFYESWNPLPPGTARPLVDTRKARSWLGLACARALNPGFDAIHPTAWSAPDEEIGLHNLLVFGSAFEAQWHVPTFAAAVEAADAVPVYHEFRRLVQTLGWLRDDDPARPWILKVPQFSQDLPALLAAFPDARLIYLDRDRADVVASSASLVCSQRRLASHDVDPLAIGRECARKVDLRADRMAHARATLAAPSLDVGYDAMSREWLAEMRRVYIMLGLPLMAPVIAAMRAYTGATHARHDYDPELFGLSA